ncbi:GNAT family N-acetyltransferase [Mycolicibacterium mengxianglii]|uniref:GNAT family N-acetyltransferase n=1 Tax=Mycolicibacterium mengxianglii TaxID=2736649 RepID=UPI0018EEDAC0|nr:GNAT family N-acetyltransferase [Mycolicibacterium mengxianglii]
MTLTDKTGAPVHVAQQPGKFTVEVEGKVVGLAAFEDQDGRRIFHHTEVDDEYGGRGLATILVGQALEATRADGLRIVPVCSMVAGYVEKHQEFDDIVDAPTQEILDQLRG